LRSIALTTLTMLGLVAAQLLIPWLIRTLISTLTLHSLAQNHPGYHHPPDCRRAAGLHRARVYAVCALFSGTYCRLGCGRGLAQAGLSAAPAPLPALYEDKQTASSCPASSTIAELFERMIAHALPDVFVNAVTLIGVTAILFSVSWQLTSSPSFPSRLSR
jgi:ABC-type multidrug transport system fused ATPase/permease subunit